jgi:UbiD family decarboxylase
LHAIVSLHSSAPGVARNAILSALSVNPSLKSVLVVNDDVNVFDSEQVEWAMITRVQADRDFVVLPGMRGSSVDPSTSEGLTAKWGIDATVPAGEESTFAVMQNISPEPALLERYLRELGV